MGLDSINYGLTFPYSVLLVLVSLIQFANIINIIRMPMMLTWTQGGVIRKVMRVRLNVCTSAQVIPQPYTSR